MASILPQQRVPVLITYATMVANLADAIRAARPAVHEQGPPQPMSLDNAAQVLAAALGRDASRVRHDLAVALRPNREPEPTVEQVPLAGTVLVRILRRVTTLDACFLRPGDIVRGRITRTGDLDLVEGTAVRRVRGNQPWAWIKIFRWSPGGRPNWEPVRANDLRKVRFPCLAPPPRRTMVVSKEVKAG